MPVSEQPALASRGHLLAVLGVGFGLAVIVGNTIGAGILRTPGVIAGQLHTFWPYMAVWIAGGLYAALGANALSELATLVPRSGGQYVFVRRGLGDYAGFVVGWSDWLSTCGTTAWVALVFGEYLVLLFPEARGEQTVALIVLAVFTLIQWIGVRSGSAVQNITSLVKALALILFIVACFWFGTRAPHAPTALALVTETSLFVAFIIALQNVIYTYDGWSAVIYFSEEVKDHGRQIPRAMLSGVLAITIIYLFINVAFLAVVSLPTLANVKFAAGVVIQHMFGNSGQVVVRVLMVLILLSAVSANVLMAPRVIYAMAHDRLFWRAAREVNKRGTPDVALLISSLLAGAFIVSGKVETVTAKLAFFFVLNYTMSFVALFVLRRREPDAPRPYRAWGHPYTTGLAFAASVVFLVGAAYTDWGNSRHSIGLLLLSIPVYFLLKRTLRRD